MSYGLETLSPSKSSLSTDKGWTEQEITAFDAIVERLKHLRNGQTAEPLVVNLRRAVLQALNNFGTRRGPMIPLLVRGNPINRILGKYRHRLLGQSEQHNGAASRTLKKNRKDI